MALKSTGEGRQNKELRTHPLTHEHSEGGWGLERATELKENVCAQSLGRQEGNSLSPSSHRHRGLPGPCSPQHTFPAAPLLLCPPSWSEELKEVRIICFVLHYLPSTLH